MFMRRDAFAMLVAVLVALCAAPMGGASGQTGAGEMKDADAMKLRASGFGEAAKTCGLERAAAIDALTGPLRLAGLEIVEQASGYWLSVRVTTIPWHDDTCVSYVETGVFQTTRYTNTATLSERVGNVQHWIDGGLFVSARSGHAGVVEQGFRDLGQRLADRWRQDQAP
jgi:hypothetical protein